MFFLWEIFNFEPAQEMASPLSFHLIFHIHKISFAASQFYAYFTAMTIIERYSRMKYLK